jgi:hypothetical protein
MNLLTYNPLRAGRLDAELKQKLEQEVISSCEGAGRFPLKNIFTTEDGI